LLFVPARRSPVVKDPKNRRKKEGLTNQVFSLVQGEFKGEVGTQCHGLLKIKKIPESFIELQVSEDITKMFWSLISLCLND
jgi:hypothetical protein